MTRKFAYWKDISILLPVVVWFFRSWSAMGILDISILQVFIWNAIFYDFLNYLEKRFLYRSNAITEGLFMPPKSMRSCIACDFSKKSCIRIGLWVSVKSTHCGACRSRSSIVSISKIYSVHAKYIGIKS